MANLFAGQFTPLGFESIAMNGTAKSLTKAPGAKYALIQASATAYWRDDGEAPTAGAGGGIQMAANAEPQGFVGDLSSLQFIGATGDVVVSYYG